MLDKATETGAGDIDVGPMFHVLITGDDPTCKQSNANASVFGCSGCLGHNSPTCG